MYLLVVLFIVFSPAWSLISPMIKTNGDVDIMSVANHVTLLEQTIANIHSQAKSDSQANAAQLAALQNELTKVKGDLTASEAEVTKLRSEIKTNRDELDNLKIETHSSLSNQSGDLSSMMNKMDGFRQNLSHIIPVVTSNSVSLQSISGDLNSTEKDLKELKDKVHSEQNRFALLIDEVKAVQKEMSSTQGQLSQVTNAVKSLSGNLTSAKSEVLSLQKNFQSSQAEVASLSSDVDKVKSNLSSILHMYAIDSYALSSLADDLDRLKEDVAFEVTLSSQSGPTTVPNGYAMKFDSVAYNVGNGYNKLTGIFTAPVSGTYIFWVNVVYRNHGSALDIYIRSSKSIIGIGYGRRVQSQDGTVVANTVANIDKGESVWFTPSVNLDVVDWHSSFGGALLRVH